MDFLGVQSVDRVGDVQHIIYWQGQRVCDALFCFVCNHALTLQIVGPLIVPLVPWKGLDKTMCMCDSRPLEQK